MKKYIKQTGYGIVALFTLIMGIFVITEKNKVDAGAASTKRWCDTGWGWTRTCINWDDKKGENHKINGLYNLNKEYYTPGGGAHCHRWSCSDDDGDGGVVDYKVFNDK